METLFNVGEILHSAAHAIDLASREIAYHQQRTAYTAYRICKELEIPEEGAKKVYLSSLLHDIGAITISEKIALHRREEQYPEKHCIKGELLFNRCPFFKDSAQIVRNHHRNNCEWKETGDLKAFSQIIYLADSVELSINRNDNNILQQKNRIREEVESKSGVVFDKKIVDVFKKISETESYWLELMSPRLESYLLEINPLKDEYINWDEMYIYSKFFRDLIDFKSPFTAAHSAGVSVCAVLIGEILELDDFSLKKLKIAGNMHDLGKLIIDDNILMKNAPLTTDEEYLMRAHPFYTFQIIKLVKGMDEIAEIAGFHHERQNRSGYPFRLNAEALGIPVKIMIIADVLTAIIEERPYRKGMGKTESFQIINNLINDLNICDKEAWIIKDNFDSLYETIRSTESAIKDFYTHRLNDIPQTDK